MDRRTFIGASAGVAALGLSDLPVQAELIGGFSGCDTGVSYVSMLSDDSLPTWRFELRNKRDEEVSVFFYSATILNDKAQCTFRINDGPVQTVHSEVKTMGNLFGSEVDLGDGLSIRFGTLHGGVQAVEDWS